MTTKLINLDDIDVENSPVVRAELQDEAVSDYAEMYKHESSNGLPPLDLFPMKGSQFFLVADGKHRIAAARKAGLKELPSIVHIGTTDDCMRFALGANRNQNGARRTNADKRACVEQALAFFPKLSNVAIAEMCGVDESLVRKLTKETQKENPSSDDIPSSDRHERISKSGKRIRVKQKSTSVKPSQEQTVEPKQLAKVEQICGDIEMLDDMGFKIPKEVEKYWLRKTEIHELLGKVNDLKRCVAKFERPDKMDEDTRVLFYGFAVNEAVADLNNLHRNLEFAMPHAVCHVCKGHPGVKTGKCYCGGKGLLSKEQMKRLPEETLKFREKVIAAKSK